MRADGPSPSPTRRRGLALRLTLAAASLLAGLALAELGLSLLHPIAYRRAPDATFDAGWRELLHQPSSTPGLAYELAPDRDMLGRGARIRTNRFGMRDDEPLPADTPGLVRIAVLGDSFTFGFGVEGNETYPSVLEAELRRKFDARGCRFDVLNFGVSGYSTRDEAVVLREKALRFEPRVIVVGYVLNDPQIEPIQPLQTHFAPVHWWQHLQLGRLTAQAKELWDRKRIGGGDFYEYLHAPDHPNWQSVVDAFGDMRAAAAARGIPVLVVIFPEIPTGGWQTYRYRHLHEQVGRAAEAAGLEVLDLLKTLSEYAPRLLRQSPIDEHPTPLADRIIADAIEERLEQLPGWPFCGELSPGGP